VIARGDHGDGPHFQGSGTVTVIGPGKEWANAGESQVCGSGAGTGCAPPGSRTLEDASAGNRLALVEPLAGQADVLSAH
jgi:T5SS/PEP-CTERM-associated repeat protein